MSYVLIADDDDAYARLVADMLVEQGYEVDRATDAMQFAAMLDKRLPQLAVVDMQMPGGGGPAAVKAVRARSPLPVIVCSGMPAAQASRWFAEYERVVILEKPVDLDALARTVSRLLIGG